MGFLDRFRGAKPAPDEVLRQELLVPVPDAGQRGPEMLEEDREISFLVVEDEFGLVLPAFTSEKALARWKPQGSAYVALQGKVLVEMLAESEWHRMVIDGADPAAFAITRSAALRLLGSTSNSVPAGSTFRIGQPAQRPPDGLVDVLRSACEREPTVEEAYLYQFQIVERDESPYMTVGLRLHPLVEEPEAGRIAQSIGGKVEPHEWGYEFLEIQLLDDQLLDAARSNGVVILRRG